MPKAIFDTIYDTLSEDIKLGRYKRGAYLPSESQLVTIFSCSRNTIRRAISMLQEEGLVMSIHGKGVQVIWNPVQQNNLFVVGGIETFAETAERNRKNVRTKVIEFRTIEADQLISDRTGFDQGSKLILIKRVRYLDEEALILDISYFLENEVRGLTKEIAERSIYSYLENELSMNIINSKRLITAEKATPEDLDLLDLQGYDFVSVMTGQVFNSNGVMFEYTQSRHHPNFFCFYDVATRNK